MLVEAAGSNVPTVFYSLGPAVLTPIVPPYSHSKPAMPTVTVLVYSNLKPALLTLLGLLCSHS